MSVLTYEKKDLPIILSMIETAVDDLEDWNKHNQEQFRTEVDSMRGIIDLADHKAKRV